MGVPKRRVSHARQGDRRSHHQTKQAHHACPNCGWYGGREAIHIRAKKPQDAAS
jgi:large subunit ribosomal protein L32